MKIVIENGIPVAHSKGSYPFADMNVGDSILIPDPDGNRGAGAARIYKMRHPGWGCTTRAVEGGVRIWRTA